MIICVKHPKESTKTSPEINKGVQQDPRLQDQHTKEIQTIAERDKKDSG